MTGSNMLPYWFAAVALTAAAALAGAPWPLFNGGEPQSLPKLFRVIEIRAGDHGHYVTTAIIEHMPVAVLVDTGASKVALSYEDAERIGLKPFALDFDQPVATANGLVKAAMVTLRRVEIENVVVHDVDGMVLPEGAMQGTLLGMSFLGRLSGFRMSDGTLYLEE
jgi:aspartyl protease family protein